MEFLIGIFEYIWKQNYKQLQIYHCRILSKVDISNAQNIYYKNNCFDKYNVIITIYINCVNTHIWLMS